MPKPKISLVIPAFNEGKYIRNTLSAAITHGAGKLHEIVVIDNGSTDDTAAIALSFPGVRVVRENNKGLTRARQRGYLEASGEILAFIDADTLMPPQWVDRIEREFSKNEGLACLSGPYHYYDVSPVQKGAVWLYWNVIALPSYWLIGYMTVGGNFAIKKAVVEKMGGFDTNIEFYGEDTNIARRASEHGKVKFSVRHKMHTSGRRFHSQGFIQTGIVYMVNFLSEVFRKKPATKQYQDYR